MTKYQAIAIITMAIHKCLLQKTVRLIIRTDRLTGIITDNKGHNVVGLLIDLAESVAEVQNSREFWDNLYAEFSVSEGGEIGDKKKWIY